MFRNLRNNYYFGKAGKADFTVDDLPATRLQLFKDTLRTRLGSLTRVNLLYALVFIPILVVLVVFMGRIIEAQNYVVNENGVNTWGQILAASGSDLGDQLEEYTQRAAVHVTNEDFRKFSDGQILLMLAWLIPCIAITGPFTAGVSYLTRNWSRDEHAFAWTDFKDAFKDNWKQALPVSIITGLVPFLVYLGVITYRDPTAINSVIPLPSFVCVVAEAIVIIAGIMWALAVTYMYPLMVTYELKFKNLMRNAFILAVARLPFSVGVRLLHCVPVAIALLVMALFPSAEFYALLFLVVWYALLGLMLSRFVTASYCNAVFDRFINPRIAGAKVNQGLRKEEDDEEEETEGGNSGKEEPQDGKETGKRVEE